MEVTFLKDHLQWKAGEKADVAENLANYWILTRVATIESETPEAIEKKLNKKLKSAKKK